LLQQGYSPLSGGNLLRLAAHFSRWLEDKSLGCGDVTDKHVVAFMRHRRRKGYTQFLTPQALDPLLRHTRAIGIVAASVPRLSGPVEQFVEQYGAYLARERGLTAGTTRGYTDFAAKFVAQQPVGARLNWQQLRPADITRFVLSETHRWSIGQVKHEVTALRSLLRYLHAEGRISHDLAGCVPAVAGWRLTGLPKALEPHEVRRVLRCCQDRSIIGRRNAAIVYLMLRLGLRAGDVATLSLDDLDWRAGEIVLRGKGRRESRLPLPCDVGRVLTAYLRCRKPHSNSRRVFLRSRAPHNPLSGGGVTGAVRAVLGKTGIRGGAHLLRHTAATQMLRHGASLGEIGDVLRHRNLGTTAIYAKVDLAALRKLAQPWPGGVE
jgi:site-specific recombinase XerD